MLIFSTRLPVKDTLTKEKFFELVVRWNQDSPHHRIDGIEWDGGYRHRWGDMKNMLEITEYNDVAAAHFVQSEHGVHWTTEFILHTERGEIGIYLSREATENTVYFHKEFKPPYFYKLTYYDDERYTVTMAKSGSDWRGGENLISEIRKRIY